MLRSGVHVPVLLEEALEGLAIVPDGCYLDSTFGRGGHSKAILERLSARGRLLAIDKDPEAVEHGRELFADEPRFHIERNSFVMLRKLVEKYGLVGKVNGILMDLGVSSPQLDDPKRGFSFLQDGPLDMRMNPSSGPSAAQWLSRASAREIASILKEYGEERHAGRIARAIVEAGRQKAITTTGRLAEVVTKANPSWERDKHPATRSFQAIRIFINRELDELREGLPQALDVLACGGRLAVISFHSLEDRIVKRFLREQTRGDSYPPGLPVTHEKLKPTMRILGRARRPGTEEIENNPRARSAVLRVAEKL